MTINRSLKVATISLSAALFTSLIPMAHGQTVGNLVFTEQSPTVLTETLDGNSIGNWFAAGQAFPDPGGTEWVDTAPGGTGEVNSPNYGLDFADPLNPGNYIDIWGPISGNAIFSDIVPGYENGEQFPGVGAGDFLPFSLSGALVNGPLGPEAVNITVQGNSVPDSSFTLGLLLSACAALAMAKRHLSKVEA